MNRTIRTAGDRGLLVEFASINAAALSAIAEECRTRNGVVATIVGHQSILVLHDAGADRAALRHFLSDVTAADTKTTEGRTIDVEVSFAPEHAPDLPRLLEKVAITRETFLREVARLSLRARFLGFRPGFAYLDGLPDSWQLPRLAKPRERVPAGSLGITGGMAGFYASESPGGWNLVGRTDAVLWDPDRDPPNLISAGDEVRIVPVTRVLDFERPKSVVALSGEPVARVVRPGQLTLFTSAPDCSRYRFGLAPSGAFDFDLMQRANASVGNPHDATALECTLVGPSIDVVAERARFAFEGDAEVTVNGRRHKSNVIESKSGDRIEIGPLRDGMRGYLAVAGGFGDPSPRFAASPGRVVRDSTLHRSAVEIRGAAFTNVDRSARHELHAIAGPHDVDASMLAKITGNEWTVTPALDRVGIRLRAPIDVPELPATLPSLGMQFGTVQWHPSGELVAMGADHPITGGYLQPITIVSTDLWKLAQLRPGEKVRFRVIDTPK